MALDGAAIDHIKLMADPCLGRLCKPAYPTVSNGAIMRFRNVFQIGVGAGETCGLFHWSPGANEAYANGAATVATAYTPTGNSVFNYLTTSSSSNTGILFRCVAACAKVMFNGSEMNRGGVIYAGNTATGSYGIDSGATTTSVGTSVQNLPYTCRIPSRSFEILWVPNEGDLLQNTDILGSTIGVGQGASLPGAAITIGFVGMPATTGVTVEVTGVYEVEYQAGNNMVSAVGPPTSLTPWAATIKGFFNYIKDSPVIMDGVKAAIDYVSPAGPAVMGANIARMAIGYL